MDRTIFAKAWVQYRQQKLGDVKEFTVKRSEWLRNLPEGAESGLFIRDWNEEKDEVGTTGKRCCLGFLANAYGYTDDEISNVGVPSDIFVIRDDGVRPDNDFPECILDAEQDFVEVNDNQGPDKVRERKLTKMFAKHGIKVNFID